MLAFVEEVPAESDDRLAPVHSAPYYRRLIGKLNDMNRAKRNRRCRLVIYPDTRPPPLIVKGPKRDGHVCRGRGGREIDRNCCPERCLGCRAFENITRLESPGLGFGSI